MIRSRWSRSLVVVSTCILMVASVLVGAQASAQSAPRPDPAALGMYVGFDRGDRFAQFERELGTPIRYVVTMADSRSASAMLSSVWGQFTKREAYLPKVSDRVNVVLSLPLAFGPGGMGMTAAGQNTIRQNLQATAAGSLDGEFRLAARYLKDAGYGDAIIRLGHEFDGDWAPYSARNNNAAYIAAFQHVHDVLKSESAAFRFEWTSMDAHFVQYGPPAYPGNEYVDIIGLDMYWREAKAISDAQWNNQMKSVLIAHQAFAKSKGKPVSYPEWGRSLADFTRFIDLMHGWFSSLPTTGPGALLYHSYFNEPGYVGSYDPYNLDLLPNVKRRYIELFGRQNTQAAPPPTTTATTVAPTTAPPTTAPVTTAPPTTAPATSAPTKPAPVTTTPPTIAPPSGTPKSSVAGNDTKAAISARIEGATLVAEWSHPAALNYIMRYKPTASPWWTWRSQSLATSASVTGVDPGVDYTVEVITNIGGTWREWNTLLVSRAQTAPAPNAPASTVPTTTAAVPTTTTTTTTPTRPAEELSTPNPPAPLEAKVAGNDTQASIELRIDNGKLLATWSHPWALNYIMRYKALDSPWWTWSDQSLSTTQTVQVDPRVGHVVQVIVNVLGKWQEWNTATIGGGS